MAIVDFVFNPCSGSFSERRMGRFVAALENAGFVVRPVATAADGVSIAPDAELVCVHGGDGTVRDVVQALGERAGQVPLAVAPSGTINLVAREIGYSRRPDQFAQQLAQAWARGPETWLKSPLYRLGELPVVSCLSIGPDSSAVARVSGGLKARVGRLAYVAAMAQQMREWPRSAISLRGELADGTPFSCEAEAVIVSRGAFYAGPFRLSPKAALASHTIELITLRSSTRLRTLAFSLAAMLHLPVDRFGFAEIRSVRRVELGRCITPVQVDGDHILGSAHTIAPSDITLSYVA
ncbi:diacylglycerol/lipid kinase family protein [Altererythrobacter sp.]|uniref:diacylglycerol/lipid kinase family protein n=1 Tax=Altererythrobacter sp. TaxID=1872480 RepID=UPI003D01AF57